MIPVRLISARSASSYAGQLLTEQINQPRSYDKLRFRQIADFYNRFITDDSPIFVSIHKVASAFRAIGRFLP